MCTKKTHTKVVVILSALVHLSFVPIRSPCRHDLCGKTPTCSIHCHINFSTASIVMATVSEPVTFKNVTNLTTLGMTGPFKLGSCTMESDQCIVVCQSKRLNIVLVDGGNTSSLTLEYEAESAIKNPLTPIIAIREQGGLKLRILNLETKATLMIHTMPEVVQYWRWVSSTTIAMVTATAVYHWLLNDTPGTADAPEKICEHHPSMRNGGMQVINYQVSPDAKWCLVVGICTSENTVTGTLQLYSLDTGHLTILHGRTGCFTCVDIPGRRDPVQILCYEQKKDGKPAVLVIAELAASGDGPPTTSKFEVFDVIKCSKKALPGDFPITMHTCNQYHVLYMMTRFGYLFVFDLFSAKTVYRSAVTDDPILVVKERTAANGDIIGITSKYGSVFQVALVTERVPPFVMSKLGNFDLALTLASRFDRTAGSPLLSCNELLNLPRLGIAPEAVKLGLCSMVSDKYIAVCDANVVKVVDVCDGNVQTSIPSPRVESAIIDPSLHLIAIRYRRSYVGGIRFQVLKLTTREVVRSVSIAANDEPIQFWKWIAENTIALVTTTTVYHWSLDGPPLPEKMFERHSDLKGTNTQIINYQVSQNVGRRWCLLTGLVDSTAASIRTNPPSVTAAAAPITPVLPSPGTTGTAPTTHDSTLQGVTSAAAPTMPVLPSPGTTGTAPTTHDSPLQGVTTAAAPTTPVLPSPGTTAAATASTTPGSTSPGPAGTAPTTPSSLPGVTAPAKLGSPLPVADAGPRKEHESPAAGPVCPGYVKVGGVEVNGHMQLYDRETKSCTMFQGHTGCFATIDTIPGRSDAAQMLCFELKPRSQSAKLVIMELGRADRGLRVPRRDIKSMPYVEHDFPVIMHASTKHHVIYMLTKKGFLSVLDIFTGSMLYHSRVINSPVFTACEHRASGGIIGITSIRGNVFHISLNEDKILPHLVNNLGLDAVALRLAGCLDKARADGVYTALFKDIVSARATQSNSLTRSCSMDNGMVRHLMFAPHSFKLKPVTSLSQCPMSDALLCALHGGEPAKNMTFEMISAITQNFEDERKLGEGTFGSVFRGDLKVIVDTELKALRHSEKSWFGRLSKDKHITHNDDSKYVELAHLSVAVKLSAPVNASAAAAAAASMSASRHPNTTQSGGYLTSIGSAIFKKKKLKGALSLRSVAENDDARKSLSVFQSMKREIEVLQNFRHPNIVQLLGYYIPYSWLHSGGSEQHDHDHDSQRRVCLIYELMESDLREALVDDTFANRLKWQDRLRIACGIAKAINFLNSGNTFPLTFHRDIKSANIGITYDLVAKLLDCGLAKFTEPTPTIGVAGAPSSLLLTAGLLCGTPGYMDPQYCLNSIYTTQSEVFSFGMVLLELITGRVQSTDPAANLYAIFIQNEYEKIIDCADARAGEWDPECVWKWATLCAKCLAQNPRHRLKDMSEVVGYLMDMDRQFCHNRVRQCLDTPVKDQTCVVCMMDDYALQEGVSCVCDATLLAAPPTPHFYCTDCFSETVRMQCDGASRGALMASGGLIFCPACTDTKARLPFTDMCIAKNIREEVYELYTTAKTEVIHKKGQIEAEARLKKEMSTVEGQLKNCRAYIEEHIVVLDCPQIIKCPNGQCGASLAMPDNFQACFALKCDSCHQQFCGWCFVHVGKDAHGHVRKCKKSGRPGNVFVPAGQNPRDVLEKSLRIWRKQQLESYLSEMPLSDRAKRRVRGEYDSVI